MPSARLSSAPTTIRRFDVLAIASISCRERIQHVGLSNHDGIAMGPLSADVYHCRPPVCEGKHEFHLVGSVPLTSDERRQLDLWRESIFDELVTVPPFDQYIIHPPELSVVDANTGICRSHRFSCVGFVVAAHRECGIVLLDYEDLPDVDPQDVAASYERTVSEILRLSKRYDWGLPEGKAWRVALPAYLLHSLNRGEEAIRLGPYQVCKGDHLFC
jgi:hypothetical protein